jgi:uncharacterized membrane protein (DUF106 family)|eukprot:scaffold3896_cov235-Chaetoceros_neogracile.AAC.14
MTVPDILYVVSTVAVTQVLCDLAANKFVYTSENYAHRVSTLERMRSQRNKALAQPAPQESIKQSKTNAKAIDKYKKKMQRVEEDFASAASSVATKHTGPRFLNSVIFFILYRILNIEYQGKVIAILPFEPWSIIRRFTMRGIQFEEGFVVETASRRLEGVNQACSFLFIYLLCNMSVKFIVNQIVGTKAPKDADRGLLNMMDDPRGQKILKELGIDTAEINEIRKNL